MMRKLTKDSLETIERVACDIATSRPTATADAYVFHLPREVLGGGAVWESYYTEPQLARIRAAVVKGFRNAKKGCRP